MSEFNLDDIRTLEESEDPSPLQVASALQRAINGCTWTLQGSYGRAMMAAITDGRCMLGKVWCTDFYCNKIPSRYDVLAGTKGSYEYVVERSGVDWANHMLEV